MFIDKGALAIDDGNCNDNATLQIKNLIAARAARTYEQVRDVLCTTAT